MTGKQMPPVPPAGRSPKGRAPDPQVQAEIAEQDSRQQNLEDQGHTANIRQNTRHQGYQQDR